MHESQLADRIRHIFLHSRPHVSIATAAALLGWPELEMNEAIEAGEIELMETPLGRFVWREELLAKALELWPHEIIEEALGEDAERVLPDNIRLAEMRARLPRYQLAMLEYFAERDQTTLSDVLTRELEGVANSNAEELSEAIPGFAAGLAWPDALEGPSC